MAFNKIFICLLIAVDVCSVLSQSELHASHKLPEDCGTTSYSKLAWGNKTEPFQYPWMVALRYTRNGIESDECGGSLINNRYVLTAAHCVPVRYGGNLSKVRLGEQDKSKEIDCIVYSNGEKSCTAPPVDVAIESTVVHPQYNSSTLLHDIALIRMAQEVTFTDSIKPICLPVQQDVQNLDLPTYIVTGWGMSENQSQSDVLLKTIVKQIPATECKARLDDGGLFLGLSEEYQMCAGWIYRGISCEVESGAPLGSDERNARFFQYGIASAGIPACGDENVPRIYSRVSSYLDWIIETMRP